MLAPSGDRVVPTLSIFVVKTTRLYYIVRLMLAPSGDRAVPTSLCFLIFFWCSEDAVNYYKIIATTMLAPSGDRAVPALFESLNCLVFVAMKSMKIVQEIVSAIRGRMPGNLGRLSRTLESMVYFLLQRVPPGVILW